MVCYIPIEQTVFFFPLGIITSLLVVFRGRLVIDRKIKQPKLNCRNWECGVIVPVTQPKPSDQDAAESSKTGKMAFNIEANKGNDDLNRVFGDTVPVPMKVPAKKYDAGDRPWFFMED